MLGIEALGLDALCVSPTELGVAPAAPAFAAIEDNATIDLICLVELYPIIPPTRP